ncbi:MAG TPA: hypothetical protein DEF06_02150 [Clostridiales bacterium]|nr:hypothetical protein [Clostridiales bacterium]
MSRLLKLILRRGYNMYDMGKVIKEQRMLRKMTQEQVAYALNVSAVTVGRWENNYKTPSLEHMVGLAVLFGVSLNTIAGLREEAVLSIDRLSESQRQLMIDIAHELSNPEKSKGLSRAKKDIICRLLDEFLKGE